MKASFYSRVFLTLVLVLGGFFVGACATVPPQLTPAEPEAVDSTSEDEDQDQDGVG